MSNLVHISAEIGTSHGGSLEKAYQLIDAAVAAGADSVKFQWVYAHEILHPNTGLVQLPGGAIPLYQRFQQLEVPAAFFQQLRDYARSKGCQFICSPFGIKSLEELVALSPDAIKIASPELNHQPLLQRLAQIRQQQRSQDQVPVPVIISSGVSTLADIEQALDILSQQGEDNLQGITLLHCITSYPAPEEEYNLQVLQNLAGIFGVEVGVSDHSLDPHLVPVLATACGARLEPAQFASVVKRVRQWEAPIKNYGCQCGASIIMEEVEAEYGKERVQAVLGTGIKKLAPAEQANYGRTNRSIHVMHDMKAGDCITPESIAILRTERILEPGLDPKYFAQIIGARLSLDIAAGQGLLWHHVLDNSTHG